MSTQSLGYDGMRKLVREQPVKYVAGTDPRYHVEADAVVGRAPQRGDMSCYIRLTTIHTQGELMDYVVGQEILAVPSELYLP